MKKSFIKTLAVLLLVSHAVSASAGRERFNFVNPNPEPLTIVNTISDVTGYVAGFIDSAGAINGDMFNPDNQYIIYPIAGDVYATFTDGRTGETLGSFRQKGTVSSTVLFSTSFFGLMGDWSQLPATMPWTMKKDFSMKVAGSTFNIVEDLTGRAFPHLGPVEDPMLTGTMSLRMAGCAGLREVSGQGKYAGTVGTLCMNGTFSFDQAFNGKGVSNCTIAIHTPIQ
jgi:hypothetical protein